MNPAQKIAFSVAFILGAYTFVADGLIRKTIDDHKIYNSGSQVVIPRGECREFVNTQFCYAGPAPKGNLPFIYYCNHLNENSNLIPLSSNKFQLYSPMFTQLSTFAIERATKDTLALRLVERVDLSSEFWKQETKKWAAQN